MGYAPKKVVVRRKGKFVEISRSVHLYNKRMKKARKEARKEARKRSMMPQDQRKDGD